MAGLLADGDRVRVRVTGSSMVPAICAGDVVEIAPARPGLVLPGDVVLYMNAEGQAVLHRLLLVRPAAGGFRLVAKGDALGGVDEPFPPNALRGRVIRITRGPGRVPYRDTHAQRVKNAVLAGTQLAGVALRAVKNRLRNRG